MCKQTLNTIKEEVIGTNNSLQEAARRFARMEGLFVCLGAL